MDLDVAASERRRHLEANEACAHDDGAPALRQPGDDGAAVGETAERVDVGKIAARNCELDGRGARGKKQPVERNGGPAFDDDAPGSDVDGRDTPARAKLDGTLPVELRRAEGDPFL